jgi:hypothetical protein
MNRIKLSVIAALVGLSSVAMAAESTRQERMDAAYQNYRGNSTDSTSTDSSKGRFARAEDSMKRGAHKTGNAIENGARKVGHAVGNGARKAKNAIKRTGEKMGGSSDTEHKQVEP